MWIVNQSVTCSVTQILSLLFFPADLEFCIWNGVFFYRPSVICGDINRIHEPLRSSKVFWFELEIFITHFDSFFTLLFGKAIKVKLVVVKVIF